MVVGWSLHKTCHQASSDPRRGVRFTMRNESSHLAAAAALLLALGVGLAGCVGSLGDPGVDRDGPGSGTSGAAGHDGVGGSDDDDGGGSEEFAPPPPTIHRISSSQYENAVIQLLGPVTAPAVPGEDLSKYGFSSVDLATRTISRVELEQYESAAYAVVDEVWADGARREALIGCAPVSADEACVRDFFTRFARSAWRRTLEAEEIDALVDLAAKLGRDLGDVWKGLRYATASVLLSPHFLWRIEMGEPDAKSGLSRFTSVEMASRLSFLIWDGLPDDALLDLADDDALLDADAVRAQAERMIDDPRARPALTKFFREFMLLVDIDGALSKDPAQFPQLTETLGQSMRLELEKGFEDVVFEQQGDFRQLLTTRDTFLNRELAELYGVDGVESDDFVKVTMPASSHRAGLLTRAGFLANNAAKNAYEAVTSPTHRGRFVRLKLMCMDIAAPPPGVDTTIPDVDPQSPTTLRERLNQHAVDAQCAGCHDLMDPIGFGLENYDAIGAWRTKDQGITVDASSELDGVAFEGAEELGATLADLEAVSECIARNYFSYANGRPDDFFGGDERPVKQLVEDFAASDYDLKTLVVDLVVNEGYRYAGEVEP